ncbi:MAG: hypothetical protein FWH05_04345 [Oscillospiraceae bacterium]|nr:hypothetical protein [Oscillospiraceae bacterium]
MIGNRTVFGVTLVVGFLAVALAVFALWQMNTNAQVSVSVPLSDEQRAEMKANAERLIENNHEVVRLYYLVGLDTKPEPYGNLPEDGIYIVDSEKYKTIADIDEIVDTTFVPSEADRIKNNPFGDSQPLYRERGGELGIGEEFAQKRNTNYQLSWEGLSYELFPETESEAALKVTLSIDGEPVSLDTTMVKQDGRWLLTKIIYQ